MTKRTSLILIGVVLVVAAAGGVIGAFAYVRAQQCAESGCPNDVTRDFADQVGLAGAQPAATQDSGFSVRRLYLYPKGEDPVPAVTAPGVMLTSLPTPRRDRGELLLAMADSTNPSYRDCTVLVWRVEEDTFDRYANSLPAPELDRVRRSEVDLVILAALCEPA